MHSVTILTSYLIKYVYLRQQYRTIKEGIPSEWGTGSLSLGESSGDPTLCPPIADPSLETIHSCQKQDSSGNRSCTSSCNLSHKSAVDLPKDKPRRIFHGFSHMSGLRKANNMADTFSPNERYQAIQRALLLNAYPVAYIILWLPDIANRLIEATGHSVTAMQFLQVARQLIGLTNALTYGWNERAKTQLMKRFSKRLTENDRVSSVLWWFCYVFCFHFVPLSHFSLLLPLYFNKRDASRIIYISYSLVREFCGEKLRNDSHTNRVIGRCRLEVWRCFPRDIVTIHITSLSWTPKTTFGKRGAIRTLLWAIERLSA